MQYMHICVPACIYVFRCSSRGEIACKYELNAKCPCCCQTRISCSFQWFTYFQCKSNIMYRKMDETIYSSQLCMHPASIFSILDSTYRKPKCIIRKSGKTLVQKQHYSFTYTLYAGMLAAFEGHWNTYVEPGAQCANMRPARTSKPQLYLLTYLDFR